MYETRTYKLTKNARKRSTLSLAKSLVKQLDYVHIEAELRTYNQLAYVAWQDKSTQTHYEVCFSRLYAEVDIDSVQLMAIETFPLVRRLLSRAQF